MANGQLAVVPSPVLALSEVREMAKAAAASGLFPALKSPDAVLTLMMLCQAEGLHPIQALRRFDIVQGRPALKSDAMLGEFQQRGGTVEWLENSAERCSAVFAAPGIARPITVTWDMEDAKRAGLAGKSGPWRQYPRQMLRARVVSEGVRMAMPAVVVGLYAPEEVQDFARPVAAVVDAVTPGPKAEPVPTAPSTDVPSEIINVESGKPITPAQVKRLMAAVTKIIPGNHKEPAIHEARITWLRLAVGDDQLASSKQLTEAQATVAITKAEAEMAKMAEKTNKTAPAREPGADDDQA